MSAQTLRDYGGFIYEGELIADTDRIGSVTHGIEILHALREIFAVSERAQFEWIVSRHSLIEASDKKDSGHMQWLWHEANHSAVCLESDGQTTESALLAARLSE